MAVIDSGASDNVIGVNTLQDLADVLEGLGFDVSKDIEVDRSIHKNFVYGGDHSSRALGLAHLNLGILGQELQIAAHVVEGNTPLLLSSKFLYDTRAVIDFRNGIAKLEGIHGKAVQLERGPGNHLLIPVTTFGGCRERLQKMTRNDPEALELSESSPDPKVENQGDEPPSS